MFKLYEEPSDSLDDLLEDFPFISSNKKIKYMNVASAFDIEASSFRDEEDNKIAMMYAWTFNLNGKHIKGRYWIDFIEVLKRLQEHYGLCNEKRMIIYVHNLAYEFQFFRCRIKWDNVFFINNREPVYALSEYGIEFRCSYILSGYSLNELGKHLTKYPVLKMDGDLDYSKIRHNETELTPVEWKYIYHDGLVVVSYIQEQIENERNNITNIPLTKTGYVRRYVRNNCLYDGSHRKNCSKYLAYRKMIRPLTIGSVNEYIQVKNAYLGAHTHANPLIVGNVIKNVYSLDFTSSYPAVMLYSKGFPMTKAHKYQIKSKEDFYKMINLYACVFDVTFYNLRSKVEYEHFIPSSRCLKLLQPILDNGKVVSAIECSMSLNEVDFKNFSRFYEWDSLGIKNFKYFYKGYLPKNLILSILNLYKTKTMLKNVEGKEKDYMLSKGMLNSTYGMMVTDICKPELIYTEDNEYVSEECDYEKALTTYNKSSNRFLFYYWGMYITSFAKYNLCDGIQEVGMDYLYSDTDSVKCLNYQKHNKWFDDYNKDVRRKLLDMCKFYKINPALIEPLDSKGEKQLIGIWDKEFKENSVSYLEFKTLGSKRYAYKKPDGKFSFTLSGCNKKDAIPYLEKLAKKENKDIMELFDDEMYIPAKYTNKNCHTYFDYEVYGEITDYLGKTIKYHEFSGVNIEPIEFTLSLSSNFIDYLLGLRGVL